MKASRTGLGGLGRGLSAATALALAGGCLEPSTQLCGDVVCPSSLVCAPSGNGCADPDQVAACAPPKVDGDACDLGVGVGVCADGLCIIGGCGNGELEAGEACDDGNEVSGDGCRGDCGKVEACGDADGAVQTIYGASPRLTFPASATSCLTAVAVVDADTVHVTDACSGLLVELRRQPLE